VRLNGILVTALVALGVVVAYDKYGKSGGMPALRRGA
jgi:hypothetical protein